MERTILLVMALGLTLAPVACSNSSSPGTTGSGGTASGGKATATAGTTGGTGGGSGGAGTGGSSPVTGGAGGSSGTGGSNAGSGSGGGGTAGGAAGSAGSITGGAKTGGAGSGGTSSSGGNGGTGGGTGVAGAIYVSPDGDDGNPGTLDKPLKTVAKARDLVRAKNSAMTADITVYLRGGTYQQSSPLTFSNADSGNGGFYVKYMAYPGERPLITGGKAITGWKDAGNGMYSADAGTTPFRQLYVNGVKAIRARTPNVLANNVANFNRLSGWDKNAHNVQVPSSAVGEWKNLNKVEMHVMIAWGDSAMRISSITTTGNTAYIKFMPDEDGIVFIRPNPNMAQLGWGNGRAYYFENAMEFLDQAGEWYLDETTHTVYYKPRTGEDMATASVVAPVVETVMSVNGTSTSSQASYLWFQGLTSVRTAPATGRATPGMRTAIHRWAMVAKPT